MLEQSSVALIQEMFLMSSDVLELHASLSTIAREREGALQWLHSSIFKRIVSNWLKYMSRHFVFIFFRTLLPR